MPSLLFWNIYKKEFGPVFVALAAEIKAKPVEIVLLAECGEDAQIVERYLTQQAGLKYRCATLRTGQSKVWAFSTLSSDELTHLQNPGDNSNDAGRLGIYEWVAGDVKFLLGTVHLCDPRNNPLSQRNESARIQAQRFQETEKIEPMSRLSIVVGDFNLDPYDEGMTSYTGFNSVLSRNLARRPAQKESTTFFRFYNPMWGNFGDQGATNRHAGTHYYYSGGPPYWHIYDQILIRSEALSQFSHWQVAILHRLGNYSLLTRSGIPNKAEYSDHLPIRMEFQLNEQSNFKPLI